ncbi:hypothetical protein PoB_003121200 [Plakobranchus ocellatus]|uniref:Uncharacterized protein n=1 Tax=Plakobranchus ocellatus TaxID=259542 RepID=A0AAV4ACR2_9GAST|nr:hypothetical protein PoB_003121200 [Plakobranchus ocellatus]
MPRQFTEIGLDTAQRKGKTSKAPGFATAPLKKKMLVRLGPCQKDFFNCTRRSGELLMAAESYLPISLTFCDQQDCGANGQHSAVSLT